MANDKETVTLKLPSGEMQDFIVPGGMSEGEVKAFILSKRPDLFHSKEAAPNDAAMQSHLQMLNAIKTMSAPQDFPGAKPGLSPFTQAGQQQAQIGENLNNYMKQSGEFAGTAAGTMATGGVLPAIKNLPLLNRAISLGGRALATGAGVGTGALAGGATPEEAKNTAIAGVAAQPIAETISPLMRWMTSSKGFGAKLLEQASAKAGNAPVELSPRTNELVDEIVREGKSGGTVPKVITDLLDRLGPSTRQAAEANPGALTYNEARSFQSNASQLSAAEQMALKGRMKSLIPQFAKSFSQDVQNAADQAGIGAEHGLGMKEYAMASGRNRVVSKVAKAALVTAGAGAGYKLLKDFTP